MDLAALTSKEDEYFPFTGGGDLQRTLRRTGTKRGVKNSGGHRKDDRG